MVFKNVFLIKLDLEFDTAVTGNNSGTGVYCHTVAATRYEDDGQAVHVQLLMEQKPGNLVLV